MLANVFRQHEQRHQCLDRTFRCRDAGVLRSFRRLWQQWQLRIETVDPGKSAIAAVAYSTISCILAAHSCGKYLIQLSRSSYHSNQNHKSSTLCCGFDFESMTATWRAAIPVTLRLFLQRLADAWS